MQHIKCVNMSNFSEPTSNTTTKARRAPMLCQYMLLRS